jgi:hypothetical protein
MKTKITMAVGVTAGTILYQAMRHGMEQIDWGRVAVVWVISFVLLLAVPSRWLGRTKSSNP